MLSVRGVKRAHRPPPESPPPSPPSNLPGSHRFSQLSIAAGRSFGSIYPIQSDGTWFRSPDEMLDAMGLLELTMTSLAEYGQVGAEGGAGDAGVRGCGEGERAFIC